jgi:hypothetical protein
VHPQRRGRDEGALDAVRAALAQHLAHREHRLAADLVVDRDRIEEGLDPRRRVEALEDGVFGAREAEVRGAREAPRQPDRGPGIAHLLRVSDPCDHRASSRRRACRYDGARGRPVPPAPR